MKRCLRECVRYVQLKLLPRDVWRRAADGRKNPEILPGTIWMVMLYGLVMQVPSLEQLERLGRDALGRVLPRGQRAPSADALRDGLNGAALDRLRTVFVGMMKRARAMKAVSWLEGFRVVAIDGSHFFGSTIHKCEDCHTAHHQGGEVTHDHAGVFCHGVGAGPKLFWGFEPVHPGEGEVAAAKRLVSWLYTTFHHFADVMVVDAGFARAPFLQHLRHFGYHFVVRLKDERMHIVRDALGLFGQSPPRLVYEVKKGGCRWEVRIWEDVFDSWEAMGRLRVVYVEERQQNGRGKGAVQRLLVATSLSVEEAGAAIIREMAHQRWSIENTAFHEGKGRFHLGHAYVHTAVAIEAVLWFQMMAMNIHQLYFRHHLRWVRERGYSSAEVAQRLIAELLYADDRSLRSVFSLGWASG